VFAEGFASTLRGSSLEFNNVPSVFCDYPGDPEEGVAVSLAVPSTSPPSHGSPTGMIKEAATPPSSPSMGSVLTVQG